jgi:hypothetical protein
MAPRRKFLALVLGCFLFGGSAQGLERSSLDRPDEHPSDGTLAALKPSYLFNMRGRQDPFVNVNQWLSAGSTGFNITGLEFKGFIVVDGQTTALFVSASDRALYTLRGSRLYGASDTVVSGVTGRLIGDKEIRLRQGETTLNFSAIRAPKRKI